MTDMVKVLSEEIAELQNELFVLKGLYGDFKMEVVDLVDTMRDQQAAHERQLMSLAETANKHDEKFEIIEDILENE